MNNAINDTTTTTTTSTSTADSTADSLRDHCQSIADSLSDAERFYAELAEDCGETDPSVMDYLSSSALDIEYIVSSSGDYQGARVLVAFGGPTIWIDTRRGVVDGAWWSESVSVPFHDAVGLDDALSELWACR